MLDWVGRNSFLYFLSSCSHALFSVTLQLLPTSFSLSLWVGLALWLALANGMLRRGQWPLSKPGLITALLALFEPPRQAARRYKPRALALNDSVVVCWPNISFASSVAFTNGWLQFLEESVTGSSARVYSQPLCRLKFYIE